MELRRAALAQRPRPGLRRAVEEEPDCVLQLLSNINFTAGQLVKNGDLLFEFATRDKELTLALAQAILKQAEAQLRLAEVNLKNAQTLRTRNVASEMRLLEAEAQRDIAAAKAEEARANVQLAELALERLTKPCLVR